MDLHFEGNVGKFGLWVKLQQEKKNEEKNKVMLVATNVNMGMGSELSEYTKKIKFLFHVIKYNTNGLQPT